MSDALESSFNEQITREFEASIVYRQLAIEMECMGLPGIASWLRHQADEEIVHANKFIDHLIDRGNHPKIGERRAPKVDVGSVQVCFTTALDHERQVSDAIRGLYRAADQEGDLDSRPVLTWFLSEQVEEEATVEEILGRIKLINNDGPGLLRLDDELAARRLTSNRTQPTTA